MPDYLNMSDEDFLKEAPPGELPEENKEVTPPEPQEVEVVPPTPTEEVNVETQEQNPADEASVPNPVEQEIQTPETPETVQDQNPEVTPPNTEETQVNAEPDYKALYESMMAPLKANGKEIALDNPDDVRRLAAMGINYTRKMQDMAPQRRLIATLQKYGLDDETKLNYLIDLNQRNPEAVKHLLKESGINPMEIDQENASQYIPGSHSVSDLEATFRSSVTELNSSNEGRETLQAIQGFDKQSQQMVFDHPGVIKELHDSRLDGSYAQIENEVNRLKMLGHLNPDVPFLAAFQHIGQQLKDRQNTSQVAQTQQVAQPTTPVPPAVQVQPIAVAARNSAQPQTGQNNGRVAAAASTRTATAVGTKTQVNPLSMSDEDFEKYHQQYLRNMQ